MKAAKSYNFNIILIVIFIITGGTLSFGFAWYNFSISLPFFRVTESLAIILYLLFYTVFINKTRINYKNSIFKYYYYFIILLLYIALKNIILSEVSIIEVIQKVRSIYIIFFIFPIITLIQTKKHLKFLIHALYAISLISSLVYIFQFVTGTELIASTGSFYKGIYRINHPGSLISSFVYFITLSHILVFGLRGKYFIYYITGLLSLIVIILSLTRGYIIATLFSTLFMFYRSLMIGSVKAIIRGTILVLLLVIFGFLFNSQFYSLTNLLFNRMEEGVNDVSYNTGTYDTRFDMVERKMSYIAKHNPLLGVGFGYYTPKHKDEVLTSKFYNNPIAMNGDSTYQNITIISGFIGLFLWLLNLYYINKKGYLIFKKSSDKFIKYVALFGSIFPSFIFLHGFSSSYFSNIGFAIISLSIGFIFIAQKFEMKYINSKI